MEDYGDLDYSGSDYDIRTSYCMRTMQWMAAAKGYDYLAFGSVEEEAKRNLLHALYDGRKKND